tara:strand:- start:585 stop:776 length:192 start_codon:yes stop_codon:yes gene_type:complete
MINIIMNAIGIGKEILKIYASYVLGGFVLMPLIVIRTENKIDINIEEMTLLALMLMWGVYSIL